MKIGNWVFAGVLFFTQTVVAATPKEKELIVLILVDALRPDHVGAYGYEKGTTPHIDELASEGTLYTRAYVNAPWTRPSTASFLTGLNASKHGVETAKEKLPQSTLTIAERLQEAGWKTAAFVANGNGGSLARLEQGFDVFRDPTNSFTKRKRGKTYNGLPRGKFIVNKALRYLKKSTAEKDFLFLFLVDPHDPYAAPARLEKRFLKNHRGKIRRRATWEYRNNYSESERRSMLAVYDASIAYADEALGDLFAALKRMKRYDNSTIIVSADHGEGFGEHGFYLHAHHFWEEVIRVPLIVKGARFGAGERSSRLTQSIDVASTIAELGGAKKRDLPGRSLHSEPEGNPWVISEYNEFGIHRQAIIGPRYKVIWQRPADAAWFDKAVNKRAYFPSVSFDSEVVRIFDLVLDPGETLNLANKPPRKASKLLSILRGFVNSEAKAGG